MPYRVVLLQVLMDDRCSFIARRRENVILLDVNAHGDTLEDRFCWGNIFLRMYCADATTNSDLSILSRPVTTAVARKVHRY